MYFCRRYSPEYCRVKGIPMVNHTVVTPDYFRTLGVQILGGREFSDSDYENPLVAIVDENLAKK